MKWLAETPDAMEELMEAKKGEILLLSQLMAKWESACPPMAESVCGSVGIP